MLTIDLNLTSEDDDGEETEETFTFPAKYEVCPECEGTGTELIEGLKGVAFTSEEFAECFDDDEDREAYFNPGSHYHTSCSHCVGRTTVLVVNEEKLSAEEKKDYDRYQEVTEKKEREDSYFRSIERAERMMGA